MRARTPPPGPTRGRWAPARRRSRRWWCTTVGPGGTCGRWPGGAGRTSSRAAGSPTAPPARDRTPDGSADNPSPFDSARGVLAVEYAPDGASLPALRGGWWDGRPLLAGLHPDHARPGGAALPRTVRRRRARGGVAGHRVTPWTPAAGAARSPAMDGAPRAPAPMGVPFEHCPRRRHGCRPAGAPVGQAAHHPACRLPVSMRDRSQAAGRRTAPAPPVERAPTRSPAPDRRRHGAPRPLTRPVSGPPGEAADPVRVIRG